MKVLHLNTSDTAGGASRAAYRLHTGLLRIGDDSRMLVRFNNFRTPDIVGPRSLVERACANIRPHFDALPVRLYKNRPILNFSPAIVPDALAYRTAELNPDIINLHWITAGFMRLETLRKLSRPLVWTLHDMWAFTGGCHYASDCIRYRQQCGACPILGSTNENDLSRSIWKRKNKSWRGVRMTVVTPSRWLAACAAESALFHDKRILVIPNSLDLNQYKPADKRHARGLLSLPQDKSLVLFGAVQSTSTARKGFPMLADALRILSRMDQPREIDAVIFGASAPEKPFDFCLKTHYLGQVNDDARLALLYAAADVFVAPSIQENLANTVMESLACGTPCVAFDIGGMPDMIEHEVNGYLVKPYEVNDFARGIAWVLEDQRRLQELSRKARQRVETSFSIESVARRYVSLYHEILSQ